MCRSNVKQEEIIIAQNGANNAEQSSVEKKIDMYGILIGTLIAIIVTVMIYIVCKKCNRKVKSWARRELATAVSTSQIDKAGVQAAPMPMTQSQPAQYA